MAARLLRYALVSLSLGFGCSSSDGAGTQSSGAGAGGSATAGRGGREATGDFLGSCDTRAVVGPSEGQCRDWVGDSGPNLEVSCGGIDGAFSGIAPCVSDGRIATCTLAPVLGVAAVYNYYEPTYGAADAQGECDGLGGRFRREAAPPPGSGGAANGGSGGGATGGGSATTGGAASGGSAAVGGVASGGSSTSCPPECFRPVQCVQTCGDTPRDYGCCPCPEGWVDTIQCR